MGNLPHSSSLPPYIVLVPKTWREAKGFALGLNKWLFRGQADAQWPLTTSLERVALRSRLGIAKQHEMEEEVLNLFKRQAHQHISSPPIAKDTIEWLSLIQHHGGPTRLLDFTSSFYVAAFFAIENADDDAVVWSANRRHIDGKLADLAAIEAKSDHKPTVRQTALLAASQCVHPTVPRLLEETAESMAEVVAQDPPRPLTGRPNVIAVKPWRLSQRMIIQQGWFLFPTRIDQTFESNLCGTLELEKVAEPKARVEIVENVCSSDFPGCRLLKIVLGKELQDEAIRDLQRMNISAATLFPGLDGFARSLRSAARIFEGVTEERD